MFFFSFFFFFKGHHFSRSWMERNKHFRQIEWMAAINEHSVELWRFWNESASIITANAHPFLFNSLNNFVHPTAEIVSIRFSAVLAYWLIESGVCLFFIRNKVIKSRWVETGLFLCWIRLITSHWNEWIWIWNGAGVAELTFATGLELENSPADYWRILTNPQDSQSIWIASGKRRWHSLNETEQEGTRRSFIALILILLATQVADHCFVSFDSPTKYPPFISSIYLFIYFENLMVFRENWNSIA